MTDDFKKQVYNSLSLKETDELEEIWLKHDKAEWTDTAFDVVKEILLNRLGELPTHWEPRVPPPQSSHLTLWAPKSIGFITLFLGLPGGVALASINWIRMKMRNKAISHIAGGMLCVFLIIWINQILPAYIGGTLSFIFNLGILFYLVQQTKADIERKNSEGFNVRNADLSAGCAIGIASWVLLVIIGAVAMGVFWGR